MQSFVTFVIGVINLFFSGFAFMKLWNWFLTETVIEPITYPVALGLAVFVRFAVTTNIDVDTPGWKRFRAMVARFFQILLTLGVGFAVSFFV